MKGLLISALTAGILLSSYSTHAQIQVGSATSTKGPGKISKENMKRFKQSTTYFVLQEKDYNNIDAFQKAIEKVWNVTPFKIILPSEMSNLDANKSSFFFFGGFVTIRQSSRTSTVHTHMSYDLYMLTPNKKGNLHQEIFGKFMLHLDGDSYRYVTKYSNGSNKKFSEKVIPYLYKEAKMNNWSPTMIAGYLKVINDGLKEEKLRSVFEEYIDKDEIKQLQNNILYIPDYVNIKYNMFTGAEKDTEEDEDDLKSAYKFPSQYISVSDLENKIAQENNNLYYLSYIKSSTDKYVSIFNSKTGKLLYTNYTPVSYNFKFKDLKRISTKVK
jgi:hypothetical protein